MILFDSDISWFYNRDGDILREVEDLIEDKWHELNALIESVHYLEPTTNKEWLMTPKGYIIKYQKYDQCYYIKYGVGDNFRWLIISELESLKNATWKEITEPIQKVIDMVKKDFDNVDLIKEYYHLMKPNYDISTEDLLVMKTPKGLEIHFDVEREDSDKDPLQKNKDLEISYGDCESEIMQELREIKSNA